MLDTSGEPIGRVPQQWRQCLVASMLTRRGLTASLAFAALTVPFGIAVHLVAELAGLGYRADANLVFSSRHAYLALFALLSPIGLWTTLKMLPRDGQRRAIERLIEALPFQGHGTQFFAVSLLAQFLFFAVTQSAEGTPLGTGDLGIGVLAALAASLVGASALSLGRAHFLRIAFELVMRLAPAYREDELSSARQRSGVHVRHPHPRIVIRTYGDLPPPRLLATTTR